MRSCGGLDTLPWPSLPKTPYSPRPARVLLSAPRLRSRPSWRLTVSTRDIVSVYKLLDATILATKTYQTEQHEPVLQLDPPQQTSSRIPSRADGQAGQRGEGDCRRQGLPSDVHRRFGEDGRHGLRVQQRGRVGVSGGEEAQGSAEW